MIKKKVIPFRWMPGSWGLAGKSYDLAKAYYELTGEDLDRRLIEINIDDPAARTRAFRDLDYRAGKITPYDYYKSILIYGNGSEEDFLDLDLNYGIINKEEHTTKLIEMRYPEGVERDIAYLELSAERGEITQFDFEKQRANLLQEPWVRVIDQGFEPDKGIDGVFLEFDWNDYWIDYLRLNGYIGNEDHVFQQWFQDICNNPEDRSLVRGNFK